MRVLHLYSGNLYGGVEALLVSLARFHAVYPSLTHEFALCYDGLLKDNLAAAGATVHLLPTLRISRPWTILRARRALADVLGRGHYDRVICHGSWSQAMFGPVARAAGVPLVYWAFDTLTGKLWTERWASLTAPDLAICPSQYCADSLVHVYPHVASAVLYYPLDVPTTSVAAPDRQRMRQAFATSDEAIVVVQAGRLAPYKGADRTIEALGSLRDVPGWVFWLAGGVQRPSEQTYLESLQASARRLGIEDCVRFLGHVADVPRLLGSADIFCQPNVEPETWGLVYAEALGSGLPVVASRSGGVPEIVDDSCGVLVPPGDIRALAAALRALIVDPARRRALAEAAPARPRRFCDPKTQLSALHHLLTAMGDPPEHAA